MTRPFILDFIGNIGATRESLRVRIESQEARYRRVVGEQGEEAPAAMKLLRRIERDRTIAARLEPRYQRAEARIREAREALGAPAAPTSANQWDPLVGRPATQTRQREPARAPSPAQEHRRARMQQMLSGILPTELRERVERGSRRPKAPADRTTPSEQETRPPPAPKQAEPKTAPKARASASSKKTAAAKKKTTKKKTTKKK